MASKASSSSSKVQKCLGEANSFCTGGGKDRISDLPDAILGEILSSFPTKEAVRTSVLSTRWRYVWTSVPLIEIDEDLLLSKDYERSICRECKDYFIDFVDRVLRLNNVHCLRKLYLRCCCTYDYQERFREWISTVTIRDIAELYLKYIGIGGPSIMLPPSLFTCKNLVILKIKKEFVLDVPASVCLPSLRKLRLNSVQFFDENSMRTLLAGCPVLEELYIKWDIDRRMNTLYIHSSSLKSLRVNTGQSYASDVTFLIDATNLERLDLRIESAFQQFDVNNLSSLVTLYLDLHGLSSNQYIELLRNTSDTLYMHLSLKTTQSLEFAVLDNLPLFPFLTHLVMDIIESGWHVVPYLLESSPNLIIFEFSQSHIAYSGNLEIVRRPVTKQIGQKSHLGAMYLAKNCFWKDSYSLFRKSRNGE